MKSTPADANPPTLYRQLLGAQFDTLAPGLQALHARHGRHRYHGKVEVDRGRGLLAWLCAAATGLPRAGRGPIKVEIVAGAGCERWTRVFAARAMRSRLWARDGLLCERLGLVTFGFRLQVVDGAITWQVERVRALGVPLPTRWFARIRAREYVSHGRYHFDVAAAVPLAGLLVHYHGWLDEA
ncbi:DUF4166 domain-containing protein [Lysobacter koreensis]|uniref:DUF4166 domain-containing protein n=1 Tax=Lysobacter koreensis TaxID=266122 RepID=A0ABW2YL61_9GAMM